jgi:FAD/FMN-containing dehydrogenase
LSIIRCAADSDVAAALAFAQGRGLEVSVRGGGRNYAVSSLTDGGVMIDLSSMKVVRVDASTKRATCGGGGTTWGELDSATQEHGLAVTGGFVSKTGVAGLTLGGGIGWLVRKAGLSCDNLVGAQVVTADGQTRHAIATENADLFWAIRGGGNFGVVTEFEFTLHEVGPLVHLGLFLFSPDHGGDLFGFAREYVRTVPEDYGVFMAGLSAPPAPFVPPELHHPRVRPARRRRRRRGEACRGHRTDPAGARPSRVDGDTDRVRSAAADVRRVRAVHRQLRQLHDRPRRRTGA